MENDNLFYELKGKILTKIIIEKGCDGDVIFFKCLDGTKYKMSHDRECCETVCIDDICGDIEDLLLSPILFVDMPSRKDFPPKVDEHRDETDTYTWTFYKLATIKGWVDIRWWGTSNGCYSEKVDFVRIEKE